MTAVDIRAMDAAPLAGGSADRLIGRIDTSRDLREVEPCWRLLQNNGLATPYQTYDWSAAWVQALAKGSKIEPMTVTVRDKRGRVVMLLPLCVQRSRGLRIGRFLGGKHANMNFPLLEPTLAAGLSSNDMRLALRTVAERHDIDLFHFENQPLAWEGLPNPLLTLPHQPSSSSAWKTALLANPDEMAKSLMSSESRKKLRHKERKLGDLGPVAYREARNAAEAVMFLEAFLRQKTERFAAMGVANPFAVEDVQAFLRAGVMPGSLETRAPITLHAMLAGERVLSVFGGAIHQGRYTGMFTSFDADPAVSRYSPGDLLLFNLIQQMCSEGLETFDLGTGDAAYKNDYCSTEEPLADSYLAFSLKGQLGASVMKQALASKRALKKSPALAGLVTRLRKLRRV